MLIGNVRQIPAGDGTPAPIVVPSTTTVFSRAFRLNFGQVFGIWLQAANGSGSANMSIVLEQSAFAPATEGASDSNYVVPDGVAPIYSNLNDTNVHVKTIQPVPMKFARLKITGLGVNPVDASLTAWIFIQELT